MAYYIGIDAGTSRVKAVLLDHTGRELLTKSVDNAPVSSGGCMEQDMRLLWEKAADCVRRLVREAPEETGKLTAIGVTGQGEGLWLIDGDGQPVQNAILWCDGRAADLVTRLSQDDPELIAEIHKTTGSPPLPGTQLMLLKWMAENRKEVLDRAAHAFFCKDWVRFQLTGEISSDPSDAGTSLLEIRTCGAASGLFERLGLREYTKLIPPIVASARFAGRLTAKSSALTGLAPGIPVVAGAIDVASCAVGAGAVSDGDTGVILGTTCAAEIIRQKRECRFGRKNSRYFRHAAGGLYLDLRASMNGTGNIDWCLHSLTGESSVSALDKILAGVPAGSGGVLYQPYLSEAGERSPFFDPHAKAGFFGISAGTGRDELVRAVYEGVSLSIRDCLQAAAPGGAILLAGGGSKSAVWPQILADVLARPVVLSDGEELGARGVMMMAAVAAGQYPDFRRAAQSCCHQGKRFMPNPESAAVYDELYSLFAALRKASGPLWEKRAAMMRQIHFPDRNSGNTL